MTTQIPERTTRYYLIYDAYNDVAEPISLNDARRIYQDQKRQIPVRKESAKELGYELEDGDILVAFKWSDLEKLVQRDT